MPNLQFLRNSFADSFVQLALLLRCGNKRVFATSLEVHYPKSFAKQSLPLPLRPKVPDLPL
jgi:hypothetical protein